MELWTPEHTKTLLPSLAAMLVIAVVLRLTMGKKDLKIRMIPFQILACVIFLLEIGKQVVSYTRGYDLYHLPFHFCSLFIFMLPLMAFYKGKHRSVITGITAAISGALTSGTEYALSTFPQVRVTVSTTVFREFTLTALSQKRDLPAQREITPTCRPSVLHSAEQAIPSTGLSSSTT